MIPYRKSVLIFFAAMALSCVPLSPDRERPVDVPHSGMKKIASGGRSFEQGWNGSNATYDEKPSMVSSFTYDYWLDSTEVTQKQYYDVTGKRPITPSSQYGVGDAYPVYYVSWFDAVLYCNARSRAERLDTVYRYSGRLPASGGGTVYELTGLWYDVSRDGYRLPTESEWEYAARGGSSALPYSAAADSLYACYYAWYTKNSLGTSHVVATRLANALGLYDMAGNVFEWTNDWKCLYDGKGITNSLGAKDPGGEYEKVIKGGSYNYPFMYLHPSHRSATYATMLSSANEYVGFRCARGVIPNGRFIGVRPTDFTPNSVTIVASVSALRSFIGTSDAKLVFVNVTGSNRTLCYVDFSRTFPYVQEYVDDRNVYMPAISPDGRYVAYCSSNEGQTGPSKISIRSLDSLNTTIVRLVPDTAYIPRWWVDPIGGDTCIVYTNSAVDNMLPAWNTTKTFLQRMSGGKAVGDPQELISDGSYHDGLSVNGQYAVTGYRHLLMKDIKANMAGVQLFVYPQNGKDASASNQVCNVSMSPDTGFGARCMFLDFGYPTGTSSVTRSSYGAHEYLFVSGMDGTVTNFLHCPAGEQTWDNPSWSNQPRFAVGCGRNGADQAHALYAIDLESKSWKQIITGTELQQPYLVSGVPFFLDGLDSIGRYNDPPSSYGEVIATKLIIFWQIFDSLDAVVIGSSQTNWGINPTIITGLKTFNFAYPTGGFLSQRVIIQNYIIKHCSNIKLICSSLDIEWLMWEGGDNAFAGSLGQSKGYLYDSSHDFWLGKMLKDFRDIISQVPLPQPTDTLNRGFAAQPSLGWGADPPPTNGCSNAITWDTTDPNYQQNLADITMLADILRSRGIHWIMVLCPVSPNYRHIDWYTGSGPSWKTAHEIIQDFREIEDSNSYFHFYDANIDGNHDYDSLDFFDYTHLSGKGAAKLSERVDSIIHTLFP